MKYEIVKRKIVLSEAPKFEIRKGIRLTLKEKWADNDEEPIMTSDLYPGLKEYSLLKGMDKTDIIGVEIAVAKYIKLK